MWLQLVPPRSIGTPAPFSTVVVQTRYQIRYVSIQQGTVVNNDKYGGDKKVSNPPNFSKKICPPIGDALMNENIRFAARLACIDVGSFKTAECHSNILVRSHAII